MANRNNGLSLVAKLNIALSEQAISEDLKKISETLNRKNLPSFIAHLNIKGSASAMNKELQELGKKLKVDFGKVFENNSKKTGKKITNNLFSIEELKNAGRDYVYLAKDVQKQIDGLQRKYDDRSISMPNSVTVKAVTNEKNAVTGLVVEYQNLEKQLVRVNYEKVLESLKNSSPDLDGQENNEYYFYGLGYDTTGDLLVLDSNGKIEKSYANDVTDEFIEPIILVDENRYFHHLNV